MKMASHTFMTTLIACLHIVTLLLQMHAMDFARPKDDSPSGSSYGSPRREHAPAQAPSSRGTRDRKNVTEAVGDRVELGVPVRKHSKDSEKDTTSKTNSSESEVVLPAPPFPKESVEIKDTSPDKSRPNPDCGEAGGCPSGRSLTHGADRVTPSKPSTRVVPAQRTSPAPSSPGFPRVGAMMEREPLRGKPRASSPRPRPAGNGVGNGFEAKSEDRTPPFGESEPWNTVKDTKKPKEGKQNETASTNGHTPNKEVPFETPKKTSKRPRIEPPPFPKPTKAKKVTEKAMKTRPTLRPPVRVTTPMLRVSTRNIERPVVEKVPEKPGEVEPKDKVEQGPNHPHGEGGEEGNVVAPEEPGKPHGGKEVQVIAPEEVPKTKTKSPSTRTKETESGISPSKPIVPDLYVAVKLTMSWREFCGRSVEFKELVVNIYESSTAREILTSQVVILYEHEHCHGGPKKRVLRRIEIMVNFYINEENGKYSKELTDLCFTAFKNGLEMLRKHFDDKILEFNLSGSKQSISTAARSPPTLGTGIIVAIVIAAIAGFCLLVLLLLQLIYRRRSKGKTMRPYVGETYLGTTANNSLDSIAMSAMQHASPNRYSAAGFMNPGLELNTSVDKRYSMIQPSNVVVFPGLPSFNLDMEAIEAEFAQLPNNMPRLSEVPAGAEHKNRYANVIPIPATRVQMKPKIGDKASEYINANFVRGHKDKPKGYIATQAPVRNTVEDFWRMVWEQQTKVIVMATGLEENGISKCEEYFPRSDGVNNTLMFGDFMVVLKLQDVRKDYILSGLTLKDVERNLCREVVHFWYTGWPYQGVPDSALSIVHFLLHVQAYQSKSKAPAIVHCSPGTGRTGTLIAADLCMKSFEDHGAADVLNTVFKIRQHRAGAVQTKEQYAFIHQAINEYALMLSEPSLCPEEKGLPSRVSRVGTSQDDIMKKY